MFRAILQYFLLYFCVLEIYCQSPEVEIPQGKLVGDTRTNVDDGGYYAFKSIPYAKPPLGELRFKVNTHTCHWNINILYTTSWAMCFTCQWSHYWWLRSFSANIYKCNRSWTIIVCRARIWKIFNCSETWRFPLNSIGTGNWKQSVTLQRFWQLVTWKSTFFV